MDAHPRPATFWGLPKRGIALLLINALFWQPIWAQGATGIVVSNGATQVTQAGNGVPVVNIAAPNASGLSHNQFQAYNVGQEGVILNNATSNVQATQLGGIIVGNANLQGRAAGTILNEVNGGTPSQLNGYTEVAGQAARVIVANPYGVTCNGCGFINTPRATLTTGKPVLDSNGKLDHYQVDGGQVSIEGTGLDASNIDQFEIITRSAKINGEIHARKLALVTGKNDVDAETLDATARAADGNAPTLAVDASALGGMYANTIRLVGTEAGVGVKLDGNLAASAGDIQLDANGHLSVAQAAASGNIDAHGRSVELNGPTYAGGNVTARADDALANRGTLAAAGNINLTAGGTLSNGSTVEAGVNPDNSRNATADVVLRAGEIANSGKVIAGRDLDAKATGTLDNRAGVLSGRQGVTLAGQHLDNRRSGTVASAGGNVKATFTGTLDNSDQGALVAQNALDASAERLDNSNGVISSGTALTLATSTALLNASLGLIDAGTTLDLTAHGFDNSGGKIQAQGLANLILSGDSHNDQGSVYSATELAVDNTGAAFSNQGGSLKSAGALQLLADSFDNSHNGTTASASLLKLVTAGALANTDGGLLYSQAGTVAISAGQFDNSGGTTQGEALSLAGGSASNQGGSLVARSGDAQLTVANFDNGTGTLAAQGLLKVVGDSFANHGQVAANRIEAQLAGALDNQNGILESTQTLSLSAGSLNNNAGKARALGRSGNTQLNLQGQLDNQNGTLETANDNLTVAAASLSNGGGQITHVGSGQVGIALALLDNAGGSLTTQGALNLQGDSWTNSTAIQASTLSVDVTTLTQTASGKLLATSGFTGQGRDWANDGEIATNGDLGLNLTGAYGGAGKADAAGALALTAASASLASTATLAAGTTSNLNITGTFENAGRATAGGAMLLRANAVTNRGTLGSATTLESFTDTLLNDHGLIFSGQSMALHTRALTNRYGNFYSFGAMSVNGADGTSRADSLENISGTLESGAAMALQANTVTNRKDVFNSVDELTAGNLSVTCYDCGGDHHNVDYVAHETYESRVTDDSPAATLQSGGNLTVEASTLANRYSTIASNGDITVTADNVTNEGAASSTTERTRTWNTGRITDGTDDRFRGAYIYPYNSQALPKTLPLAALNQWRLVSDISTVTDNGTASNAVIQAAGSVRISGSQNISNVVEHQASSAGANQVASTTADGVTQPLVVQLNAQLPPDLAQQQVNPTTLPGFVLPSGDNGLFRLSDPSTSTGVSGVTAAANPAIPHRYLIETNPALTDMRQFMSSDYLLGLLDYNPDSNWKRLGDGLYEQRLVQQAITARTGQALLDGMASNEAQFKYLMDNALASKQALNLSVGVALTSEQVAALTHDIVWMQDQVVNGEHVLVPVLYLANANDRLAPSGALVQGRDVTLIAGENLSNSGTLKASDNLTVQAVNDLANSRLMQAGQRLDLTAGGSVSNRAGGILKGRDVSVTTLTGDINNARSIASTEASGQGFSQRTSVVDNAARIEASNDLTLTAGHDINNVGGALQAGGKATLTAANDVLIAAAEETNSSSRQDKRHSFSQSNTTQHASEVTAGTDLSVKAGNDLSVVASHLKAGGNASLEAGNDLNLASAANETASAYNYKGHGKKVKQQEDHISQVATTVETGGDVTAKAGQNLTLVASQIDAGGEAYVYAGDQLNVLAAQNSDYSLYDMKKKGSFGSKKTKRDEVTDVTNIGSQVKAVGDITLASGGDQTYQGARLETAKNLTLDSGGAITFEAVKDLHQESHEKSSNSLAWTSMSGKGKTDETVRQTQIIAQGAVAIKAVDGLHIDVKQVNQQTVSQAIDAMVKADPQMAWLKEAEARGDVDWRQVKEVHDSYKYSHSGLGGAAQLVIAIVIAYFTAGLASGLVAGAASSAGASVTAGSAWAAGTAATATTAGAAAGWANAAVTAVLVGMETNAAIGFINNGGDLGLTLKQAVAKDALKGYAVSGITAGLTTGLYDKWTSTETGQSAVEGVAKTSSTTGALSNTAAVTAKNGLSTWSGIGQFAAGQTLQNSTSALLNKALGQKGSLGDALQQSLVNTFVAAGFNLVGDIGKEYDLDDGKAAKIGLHALMGGLAAEAMGGDFKTGALAAGVNEAIVKSLSDAYGDMDPNEKKRLLVMNSQLIGVLSASLQGGDQKSVEVASAVTSSATQYNWLLHGEIEQADKARKACESQGGDVASCKANVTRAIDELDRLRDLDYKNHARAVQMQAYSEGGWTKEDYDKAVNADYFSSKGIDRSDVTFSGYAPAKTPWYVLSNTANGAKDYLVNWPGNVADGISNVANDPIGAAESVWDGMLDKLKWGKDYLTSPIPAQLIDQSVDNLQAKSPEEMGHFLVDQTTGLITAELGGVLVKWVGGRWVESKVGATTPVTKGPCCFAAGTKVSTPQGDRAIESLKVGDVVWSKPEKGGKPFAAAILATHQRSDQPIYRLKLKSVRGAGTAEGETLLVTPSHPFYVPAKRDFIPVIDLKPGDLLQSLADGDTENTSSEVESLELYLPRGKTYNLTVDVGHTFYVGELKTWVHNTGPCDLPPGKFDYLFGRVSSDSHNAARSNQLALEMKRLGVPDNAVGRQMLTDHLTLSAKAEGNVVNTFTNQYGRFEVRESLFIGPSGKAANFQSTFQVLEDGTRRLSTLIPLH
ncbi:MULTISPECIES: filamentous hemagglutinin N-terminal domain-containing protein [unclassified Pseudomonas]|uniref:two-partner secretion domain-containing protein n=1 Tax=unclassified Pseudomonas TaxID=196821 RepID=UPI000BCEA776|nr:MULTISPECIES: filamentous hemagglutinin N-terminal domain-containing protein [unclassified Pseudomonas]PVZ15419.1 filamentous hemagglutinin [Pseudomonas sp. URIL14HWK12:I12]PVZ24793.1 filamentous hemagglutinin [Pseudomonas sp. URIL14HWK12:I10]PVZ34639.1 filamentous hemagglutinin [Pseudomonas sp. URIL14HWK12:I11]SNZ08837.1 filamentous hemagglutinin [Pseudomonas sp. URIL14HWK12:I9]